MSASSSDASRRVYTHAHRRSYVSQSGLVEVLKSVKENGLPSAVSRGALKRARRGALMNETPMGSLMMTIALECTDGRTREFPCINPLACLWMVLHQCQRFSEWFYGLAPSSFSAPWDLTVYCDEIVPGNPLKPTNERKIVAFYWSILQFGRLIHAEELWFHILVIRSSHMKKIRGGYSQVLAKVSQLFFAAPWDLRMGIQLSVPGMGDRFLFGRLSMVVADEAALKQLWSFKGAGGTMMCFKCSNVVAHSSRLDVHDASGVLVPSCVTSLSQCRLQTSEAIKLNAKHLRDQSASLNKTRMKELEQALGLTYEPCGVLWSDDFQEICSGVVTVASFDWMHCYMVNGVLNTEIGYLLDHIKDHISTNMIHEFLGALNYPSALKSRGTTGKKSFEKHSSGELKCSASEGLSIYPCLRSFLMENLPNHASFPGVASYIALCEVLDLLVKSRSENVAPALLQSLVEKHLAFRLIAYGPESFQPKVHFTLHMSHQLERFGFLVACWVHERKHRELKRFANNMHSASASVSWEKGLLEEVLLLSVLDLENFKPKAGVVLQSAQDPSDELLRFLRRDLGVGPMQDLHLQISETVLKQHLNVGRGDCIVASLEHGSFVGEVWFHCSLRVGNQLEPEFFTVASEWLPTGVQNKYQIGDQPCLIPTESIQASMPYIADLTGVALIIM